CIIDENTINDNASDKLQGIKKKQHNLEQDIHSKLTEIIHSSKFSKYIQESIITVRNDRFVVPIKEEYRNEVKGFIHDISNAGATLFIEPLSVFELNNEINRLKLEEQIEIQKILQDLCNLVYPYIDELNLNLNTIGQLDFIFAKAKYAKSINANIPQLSEKKEISLINAKHPLLEQNTAVPISLSLGDSFSTLLITGPNTGGKTVTLKTVGLLTCMLYSGLAIPASESSKIYVFNDVFADIGDEQSISNSLSTFSSHLLNIVDIIKFATSDSLILLDELALEQIQ
ncbi:endonuclease MutS2, partial [bacterium]|nr:endonuclease MutS2 [bacterium]